MNRPTLRPVWIWMDVSATCNLDCRDCYTKAAHEPALLSPTQFGDILRQFKRPDLHVRKLHLNWRGEPLINKRLPEMLRLKRELLPDVALEFHTHGMLLNRPLAQEILQEVASEDRIYVSVDGGSPEAHEANRGPGTWSGALQCLRLLLDARNNLQSDRPTVGIYEITYERRTRAHADLVALGRRCDEWTRVAMIGVDGGEASFTASTIPSGPCFWAGHALCVTARGDVHVCLLSFRPDGRLGNLFTDDLTTILDRSAAFRRKLIEIGRPGIAHCRICQKTEGEMDEGDLVLA